MTPADGLLSVEKGTVTHTLMIYVVKRTHVSAHNAFISTESGAGCQGAGQKRGIQCFDIPALSPLVCDAPLLLLKKKEGWTRCIMGTEESDDRKHSEGGLLPRTSDLTLPVSLCNLANCCSRGKKNTHAHTSRFLFFLLGLKLTRAHSCAESVS